MAQSFHESFLPLIDPPGDADEAAPQALTGRLPSYIADHRQRLRDRFLQAGGAALPDYELLELVLFRALPRQDVKPLARRLIDTFGDFGRVLSAPTARLMQVTGVGPAVVQELKIVEAPTSGTALQSAWSGRSPACRGTSSATAASPASRPAPSQL